MRPQGFLGRAYAHQHATGLGLPPDVRHWSDTGALRAKQRESAVRTTIGELNQRLLKRILWVASSVVILQFLGFGFLAFKIGLLK
jgi:hypothetical protein